MGGRQLETTRYGTLTRISYMPPMFGFCKALHEQWKGPAVADYWLTFRIHENRDYKRRYDALIEAVNESGDGFWDGPTSFFAIRSGKSIDELGWAYRATIDDECDLFVIREIGKDSTRYAGDPGPSFPHFFPNAKKL